MARRYVSSSSPWCVAAGDAVRLAQCLCTPPSLAQRLKRCLTAQRTQPGYQKVISRNSWHVLPELMAQFREPVRIAHRPCKDYGVIRLAVNSQHENIVMSLESHEVGT
jgi:hypothetical protein